MIGQSRQVRLRILDKEYIVACPEDEYENLLASADYLTYKVQDVRKGGKVVGSERVVVMAALHIAHELIQLQKRKSPVAEVNSVEIQRVSKKIEETLAKLERV